MSLPVAELKEEITELSLEAYEAFCEDISGMFGIDMTCREEKSGSGTIKEVKKKFRNLAAVYSVNAKGTLEGDFKLLLDKQGVFTLPGTIVMQPKEKIIQNAQMGKLETAEEIRDAVGECGNLLVGSWDRIYRENLDGHEHFVQTNTFLGNPWKEPDKKINIAKEQQIEFCIYEMTIGDFEPFKCGVIFPSKILPGAEQEQEKSDSEKQEKIEKEAEVEQSKESETELKPSDKQKENEAEQNKNHETPESEEQISENIQEENTSKKEDKKEPPPEEKQESQTQEEKTETQDPQPEEAHPKNETEKNEIDEKIDEEHKPDVEERPVSDAIKKMTGSESDISSSETSFKVDTELQAKDIMQTNIVWCKQDDTVEKASNEMQSKNTSYLLIGSADNIEGIISRSNLASGISPYLKPVFAKWRRPLDDATLQIKLKWIMTRPVKIIPVQTPVPVVVQKMLTNSCKCFPVADEKGKIVGIVTAFDIFKAITASENEEIAGQPNQSQMMV